MFWSVLQLFRIHINSLFMVARGFIACNMMFSAMDLGNILL